MSYIVRNKLIEGNNYKINKKIYNYAGKSNNKYCFQDDNSTILLRENKLLLVKNLI